MLKTTVQAQVSFPNCSFLLILGALLFFIPLMSQANDRPLSVFDHIEYADLDVHLGFENEVSTKRLNYPLHILISGKNWQVYNEQFRQLGELTDLWDKAQRGEILLDDIRNIPLAGMENSSFQRKIRIVRADWDVVGEKCGYRSGGRPHSGCSYNKRLPKCTIIVPHQQSYEKGDINEYHQLLGHEMWHCLVGSFH